MRWTVPNSAENLVYKSSRYIVDVFLIVKSALEFIHSDGGIMVSIAAFQAVDPGSIPGHRKEIFFFFLQSIYYFHLPLPYKIKYCWLPFFVNFINLYYI